MLDAGLASGPEALHPEKLSAFVDGAMEGYNGVAFHNMYHGFSVMHVTASIIIEAKAVEVLSWHDVAVALLAAIGHDLDHPGTNNGFEVSTVSERACRHGFDSVCCHLWKMFYARPTMVPLITIHHCNHIHHHYLRPWPLVPGL